MASSMGRIRSQSMRSPSIRRSSMRRSLTGMSSSGRNGQDLNCSCFALIYYYKLCTTMTRIWTCYIKVAIIFCLVADGVDGGARSSTIGLGRSLWHGNHLARLVEASCACIVIPIGSKLQDLEYIPYLACQSITDKLPFTGPWWCSRIFQPSSVEQNVALRCSTDRDLQEQSLDWW